MSANQSDQQHDKGPKRRRLLTADEDDGTDNYDNHEEEEDDEITTEEIPREQEQEQEHVDEEALTWIDNHHIHANDIVAEMLVVDEPPPPPAVLLELPQVPPQIQMALPQPPPPPLPDHLLFDRTSPMDKYLNSIITREWRQNNLTITSPLIQRFLDLIRLRVKQWDDRRYYHQLHRNHNHNNNHMVDGVLQQLEELLQEHSHRLDWSHPLLRGVIHYITSSTNDSPLIRLLVQYGMDITEIDQSCVFESFGHETKDSSHCIETEAENSSASLSSTSTVVYYIDILDINLYSLQWNAWSYDEQRSNNMEWTMMMKDMRLLRYLLNKTGTMLDVSERCSNPKGFRNVFLLDAFTNIALVQFLHIVYDNELVAVPMECLARQLLCHSTTSCSVGRPLNSAEEAYANLFHSIQYQLLTEDQRGGGDVVPFHRTYLTNRLKQSNIYCLVLSIFERSLNHQTYPHCEGMLLAMLDYYLGVWQRCRFDGQESSSGSMSSTWPFWFFGNADPQFHVIPQLSNRYFATTSIAAYILRRSCEDNYLVLLRKLFDIFEYWSSIKAIHSITLHESIDDLEFEMVHRFMTELGLAHTRSFNVLRYLVEEQSGALYLKEQTLLPAVTNEEDDENQHLSASGRRMPILYKDDDILCSICSNGGISDSWSMMLRSCKTEDEQIDYIQQYEQDMIQCMFYLFHNISFVIKPILHNKLLFDTLCRSRYYLALDALLSWGYGYSMNIAFNPLSSMYERITLCTNINDCLIPDEKDSKKRWNLLLYIVKMIETGYAFCDDAIKNLLSYLVQIHGARIDCTSTEEIEKWIACGHTANEVKVLLQQAQRYLAWAVNDEEVAPKPLFDIFDDNNISCSSLLFKYPN